MDWRAIPDDQEVSGNLLGEKSQEGHDLLFTDAMRIALAEDLAVNSNTADGRELVPLAAVSDFRCFSSRCPGRFDHAFEARPDFVYKDNGRFF